MKWSTILAASTLIVTGLSSPIARQEQLYNLRTSSDFEPLNDKYLSTSNATVGIYSSGDKSSATRLYTSAGQGPEQVSLHTFPIGIVDHAFGLVGADGYLQLQDLTQPAGKTVKPYDDDSADTYSWQEFTLSGDDKELRWGKDDVVPGWIAKPAGDEWIVKFYDGQGGIIITQDYIPIKITLEAVEQ